MHSRSGAEYREGITTATYLLTYLQPMTAHWIVLSFIVCFIARFILLVIAPLNCMLELSRDGVARCLLDSQLAHDDCRRIWSKIWKLNMLSWVELCRAVYARTRRQSWLSFQFCSQLDWINSQHVQFSIFRPNLWWTSCEFNTQLDSWVASASAVYLYNYWS